MAIYEFLTSLTYFYVLLSELPEYHAVTGGRAELPCNITQHSSEDKVSLVLWYKEDARAPIYSVDARNSPLEKAKHFPGASLGSRAYFETFTKPTILRIEPIQEKDAGIYRCRVDYRWARTFTHSMMLNVIGKPHLISGSRLATNLLQWKVSLFHSYFAEISGSH
ncbi:hypothetical protein AVEN_265053-1 [Araneus ventricosus]|uniref:Ig-like domain-containing protein n=1 Tax=Araneus ventricosus TaxID=182803 RepID=A0A4Y2TZR5_ARAVE|nr:hypothetical protein AVEN_228061-1 [Araneus ventricosus]GBO05578.1 hypothetical protein AVEN_3556-1 [Araneus ventricosus]GBO06206.1 hypothetical protein AVEN_6875-1 [Araneus ventricosus]GBO06209.1 hypothetical protein AVEN_265053-1 [Araneus ventricosus]